MTVDRVALEALLRDPKVPWAVNLSNSGDRMIAVTGWVTFAVDRLGDVVPQEVEQASDELVIALGGEKLEVQDIRTFLVGTVRRLVGREKLGDEWSYVMPAALFGDAPFTIGDQLRAASEARKPAEQ